MTVSCQTRTGPEKRCVLSVSKFVEFRDDIHKPTGGHVAVCDWACMAHREPAKCRLSTHWSCRDADPANIPVRRYGARSARFLLAVRQSGGRAAVFYRAQPS